MKNTILELKGKRFIQESRKNPSFNISMNRHVNVTCDYILNLKYKLEEIKKFWKNEKKFFDGIIISVYYNKIVAKSNRIAGIFKGKKSNDAVVGVKFNSEKTKHIITYYLEESDLNNTILLLEEARKILKKEFLGEIDNDALQNDKRINKICKEKHGMTKSAFKQIIADVSYIENFEVEIKKEKLKTGIITFYKTNIEINKLLKNLGINIVEHRMLDEQTVLLDENQIAVLYEKAPYLIAMATENLSELTPDYFMESNYEDVMKIPIPHNEPTIGVIDTLFDDRVYFSEWVEYHEILETDNRINKSEASKHGTAVSSIIVDGPRLNSWLDDGCGRFKVRHFGITDGKTISAFFIIKKIKEIIAENRDIKVWNLSLGSNEEINDNFISVEAAVLDEIQYEYDVIFVIAGTNKNRKDIVKIGSPADSLNSMVVNAVTIKKESTVYSRKGPALSFFTKPDVSYYGGSKEKFIAVCEPLGKQEITGTSFAAPWIARKLSYLIDILGFSKEVAKALIIDAARGWETDLSPEYLALYGNGVVPIKISDIISTPSDEIKFLIYDVSEKYNSYCYNFPVPLEDNKYPYAAKATMCYFPKCNRLQGVDYTNTELSLAFGRINDKGNIKDINNNSKDENYGEYIFEKEARNEYQKWNNTKCKCEKLKKGLRSKISYNNKNWGITVKTKNRLNSKDGENLHFGIVVTLKEINGKNRIDEFIKNCILQGWLVNKIDIEERIEFNSRIKEDIELE